MRELIAKFFYLRDGGTPNNWEKIRNNSSNSHEFGLDGREFDIDADNLLALEGEHNGRETKLVEVYVDGELPENPYKEGADGGSAWDEIYYDGYNECRSDILKANFRQRVER